MKGARHRLFGGVLVVLTGAAVLVWNFYEYMPWVGTHFDYVNLDAAGAYVLNLTVAEGSAVQGGTVGLEQVPKLSRNAAISLAVGHQGQRSGGEVLQVLKPQQVESVQYSWEQKNTDDLLKSTWEARLAGHGGLTGLQVRPPSRSLWMRPELSVPWIAAAWPPFLKRGVDPKARWTSEVPFQIQPEGLSAPLKAHWDCTWTFRGTSESGAGPLAVLDLEAQAGGADQSVKGALRGEVAFSLDQGRTMAARGAYQFGYAAHGTVGEGADVTALDVVQCQFQLVRVVARKDASATPAP